MKEVFNTEYKWVTSEFKVFLLLGTILLSLGFTMSCFAIVYSIYRNPTGLIIMPFILIAMFYAYILPVGYIQSQIVFTQTEIKIIPHYLLPYWWNKTKVINKNDLDQFYVGEDTIHFYHEGKQLGIFQVWGKTKHRKSEVERISTIIEKMGYERIYSLKYLKDS